MKHHAVWGTFLGLVAASAAAPAPIVHEAAPVEAFAWPDAITLEVDALGTEPLAVDDFADALAWLLGRHVTVVDVARHAAMEGSHADLAAVVAGHDATVHLLLRNGTHWVGGQPASGLAYIGERQAWLFPDALRLRAEQAERMDELDLLTRVVATHEAGHVVGLVGCGLGDRGHGCHSENTTSIMHAHVARMDDWPVGEGPLGPFGWDADDLADVASVRLR